MFMAIFCPFQPFCAHATPGMPMSTHFWPFLPILALFLLFGPFSASFAAILVRFELIPAVWLVPGHLGCDVHPPEGQGITSVKWQIECPMLLELGVSRAKTEVTPDAC